MLIDWSVYWEEAGNIYDSGCAYKNYDLETKVILKKRDRQTLLENQSKWLKLFQEWTAQFHWALNWKKCIEL